MRCLTNIENWCQEVGSCCVKYDYVALKLFELVFREYGIVEKAGLQKQLSTVSRAFCLIPIGDRKARKLREKRTVEAWFMNLQRDRGTIKNWDNCCDILIKIMISFCSCLENLSKV